MDALIITQKPAAVPPGWSEREDIVDLKVENTNWVDLPITLQTTKAYSGDHPNGEGVELQTVVVPARSAVEVFNVYPYSLPKS